MIIGDFGLNSVYITIDIDSICDCSLMGILHHQVLIEETQGLFQWSGSHTYQDSIKVFQYLPPRVIDGTMAFIDDYEVKGFDRDIRIIVDLYWLGIYRFYIK